MEVVNHQLLLLRHDTQMNLMDLNRTSRMSSAKTILHICSLSVADTVVDTVVDRVADRVVDRVVADSRVVADTVAVDRMAVDSIEVVDRVAVDNI